MAGAAHAGDTISEIPAVPPPAPLESSDVGSAVSGSLNLDYNTHFISYGLDVWGAGNDFSDALFNPSLELSWDLGNDVSFFLGTWWDVNDNAVSDIGGKIQEIDVWAGIGFKLGPLDASLTYQAWFYAEDTEQIIDFILSSDAPFAPSVTFHGRPDEGASGGDTGLVTVLGADAFAVGDGISLGPVSLGLPINVGFATDGYHGGDGGFAYGSLGISASAPLYTGPLGEWDIHAGITYYYTDDSVIPSNPDDSFFTGSIGIGCSF